MSFTFFLASELRMTVAEMEDRMSSDEFMYWVAYYNIKHMREELGIRKAAGGGKGRRR